ncbi:hypothetical protein Esti_000557 [Eimeria stiedai]
MSAPDTHKRSGSCSSSSSSRCSSSSSRRKALGLPSLLVLVSAAAVRLLLFSCLSLPSPLLLLFGSSSSSSSAFREGLAREAAGLSPFAPGVYGHLPPLFYVLKSLTGCSSSTNFSSCNLRLFLLLLLVDLGIGAALAVAAAQLGRSHAAAQQHQQQQQPPGGPDVNTATGQFIKPWAAAALYLLHPYALAASLAMSLQQLPLLLLALSIAAAAAGARERAAPPTTAAAAERVAVAAPHHQQQQGQQKRGCSRLQGLLLRGCCCCCFTLLLLLGPPQAASAAFAVAAIAKHGLLPVSPARATKASAGSALLHGCLFLLGTAAAAACLLMAVAVGANWDSRFVAASSIPQWRLENPEPGLSPSWYLLTLVFERYRSIFIFAFQAIAFVLAIPLTICFAGNPLPHCQAALGAIILFQPTPSLTEFAFLQVLLAFEWQQLHQRIAFSKLVGLGMVCASILPVGISLWSCRRASTPNPPYALQSLHHVCTCRQQQQQQAKQHQQRLALIKDRCVVGRLVAAMRCRLAARGDPQSLCTEAAAAAAAAATATA